MFCNIKNNLYLKKINDLYKNEKLNEKIVPFTDDLYEKFSHTYISNLPVSIHIKYLRPQFPPMKCLDRSLYMFMALDDAVLVRANSKYIEISHGEGNGIHGWVEKDNYVYDPTVLEKFDRDLYYEMFGMTDIMKTTIEEYCTLPSNKEYYEDIKSTTIEDYKPNGKRRLELITTIPLVRGIAQMSNDESFIRDLNNFLEEVDYDEKQIYDDTNHAFQKAIRRDRMTIKRF